MAPITGIILESQTIFKVPRRRRFTGVSLCCICLLFDFSGACRCFGFRWLRGVFESQGGSQLLVSATTNIVAVCHEGTSMRTPGPASAQTNVSHTAKEVQGGVSIFLQDENAATHMSRLIGSLGVVCVAI